MIRIILVLTFLFVGLLVKGQPQLSTKNKKAIEYYVEADNYRVRRQTQQAIELLNMALEKDKNFAEAYYRLGLVYLETNNYTEAIKNYEKGLSLVSEPAKQKVFWYDMGDCFFSMGQYDKAETCFNDFLKAEILNKQKIEHARQMLKNIEFARQAIVAASKYNIHPLSDTVNCFGMQYFPVLTADQQSLIFTRRLAKTPDDDEDLVLSEKDTSGKWKSPVSISKNINSSYNEGTSTISADGRLLIFTSCVGRQSYGSCDLYESHKIGNDWSEPVNLGLNVNSADWESQPSLSADGRTLYFVSDRRGGIGRRDIWTSYKNEKGEWTKAKNIGRTINTVYDEISPFIHVNNRVLYFASNGLTGFGGYDIYYSEKDTAGLWSPPVNFGAPINNHEDQFSLFITADGKKGYYSHEEALQQGLTRSKIYETEIPEEKQIKFKSNYVKGVIRDKQTQKPLAATIELINLAKGQTESFVNSDSVTGQYLIVLTQGAEYALYVNKKGYLFNSRNFNYSEVKDFKPITQNIDLEKVKGGSFMTLNNIFFDVDKYELKEKSATELNKIIKFLNDNPKVKVEISGHTDNTGSTAHNKLLSEMRAKSVYNYLVKNGIPSTHLVAKGYGSDQPIAPNNTEEARQLNRRIEFKILP
ncbi:MAG TPA: OmpA family protein [Cyclobacteriaceae bacterium]